MAPIIPTTPSLGKTNFSSMESFVKYIRVQTSSKFEARNAQKGDFWGIFAFLLLIFAAFVVLCGVKNACTYERKTSPKLRFSINI